MRKDTGFTPAGNLPILRKKGPDEAPALKMEFRIVEEPTFNEDEVMTAPPHWEIRQEGEADPIAWGPIKSARAMYRLFEICVVAQAIIPPDVLASAVQGMQPKRPAIPDDRPDLQVVPDA